MDYKIAIPTYKRVETIKKKTLKILRESDINPSIIYIFVANQEEYDLYSKSLNPTEYNKIVIGVLGLGNQRNFIGNYFNQDDKIIFMDDDIMEINAGYRDAVNNELVNLNIPSLNKLFINSFNECIEQKCNLFGYYPIYHNYFMKPSITTDLRYIIGSLYGIINKQDRLVNTDDKEDVERTLEYFVRDGRVMRINFVGIKTAYYTEKGGLQETRTEETIEKGALYIHNKYPFLTSIKYKKTGKLKRTEIVFNNKIDTKVFRYPLPNTDRINELKQKLFKSLMEMKMDKLRSGIRRISKGGNTHYNRGHIIMSDEDLNNKDVDYKTTNFGYSNIINRGKTQFKPNIDYPEIYEMLVEFGKLISPEGKHFSAITCNKNLKCKYHRDGLNCGSSVFITLGDYTGGGIYIEGREYDDVRNYITIFNGHHLKHATKSFEGDRIALIYYNILKDLPTEHKHFGQSLIEPSSVETMYDTKI